MYSESSFINKLFSNLFKNPVTYIFVCPEIPPFTNIVSPPRPCIWAHLFNGVEEALIHGGLNPLERVSCHVGRGAWKRLERAVSCGPHPCLHHWPRTLMVESRTHPSTKNLQRDLCIIWKQDFRRILESSGSFCVSSRSPEPVLRNMFSVEAQMCFVECAILP